MSWSITTKGTRTELQAALNKEANMPDSVKGFVANATAYYTDDTQLDFESYGHAHEGLIRECTITLKAQAAEGAKPPAGEEQPEPK